MMWQAYEAALRILIYLVVNLTMPILLIWQPILLANCSLLLSPYFAQNFASTFGQGFLEFLFCKVYANSCNQQPG